MGCERCNGLVMAVSFTGGDDARAAWEYDGWKCMNCGYITDPLSVKNRAAQARRGNAYLSADGRMAKTDLLSRQAA